ncbi:hypothetical protein EDB87DRAFT_1577506 [Lactarius vividus]|nr:hypothetical protein EDB87DRAFT_1577506 [Lactarius vividus]
MGALPTGWPRDHPPPAPLRFTQAPTRECLDRGLYQISDPEHPRCTYVRRCAAVAASHGGGWPTLTGVPVSQANALFGASYHLYQHAETKDRVLRTVGYAPPAVLHASRRAKDVRACGGEHRESRQRRWCQSRDDGPPPSRRRTCGGYTTRWARRAGTCSRSLVISIGAGTHPNVPGWEMTVDIQHTEAIVTIVEQPLLMWLAYMSRVRNVPQTSFSGIEQEFAKDYVVALCCQFVQRGMRGASLIFPSGDDGIGRGTYMANDGSVRVPSSLASVVQSMTTPGIEGLLRGWLLELPHARGIPRQRRRRLSSEPQKPISWCSNPTGPYIVLCTALRAAASPTSPRRRTITCISTWVNPVTIGTVAAVISLLRTTIGFQGVETCSAGSTPCCQPHFKDIRAGLNPGCGIDGFSATVG